MGKYDGLTAAELAAALRELATLFRANPGSSVDYLFLTEGEQIKPGKIRYGIRMNEANDLTEAALRAGLLNGLRRETRDALVKDAVFLSTAEKYHRDGAEYADALKEGNARSPEPEWEDIVSGKAYVYSAAFDTPFLFFDYDMLHALRDGYPLRFSRFAEEMNAYSDELSQAERTLTDDERTEFQRLRDEAQASEHAEACEILAKVIGDGAAGIADDADDTKTVEPKRNEQAAPVPSSPNMELSMSNATQFLSGLQTPQFWRGKLVELKALCEWFRDNPSSRDAAKRARLHTLREQCRGVIRELTICEPVPLPPLFGGTMGVDNVFDTVSDVCSRADGTWNFFPDGPDEAPSVILGAMITDITSMILRLDGEIERQKFAAGAKRAGAEPTRGEKPRPPVMASKPWKGTTPTTWDELFCRVNADSRGKQVFVCLDFYRNGEGTPGAVYYATRKGGSREPKLYAQFLELQGNCQPLLVPVSDVWATATSGTVRKTIKRYNRQLAAYGLPDDALTRETQKDGRDYVRFNCRIKIDAQDRAPVQPVVYDKPTRED